MWPISYHHAMRPNYRSYRGLLEVYRDYMCILIMEIVITHFTESIASALSTFLHDMLYNGVNSEDIAYTVNTPDVSRVTSVDSSIYNVITHQNIT